MTGRRPDSMCRDERTEHLERALLSIGYTGDMLVRQYRFLASESVGRMVGTVDLAAFGDARRRDLGSCCIAGMIVEAHSDPEAVVHEIAYLAPPVALLAGQDKVEAWAVRGHGKKPIRIGETPYGRLSEFVDDYRWSLLPEVLLAAKHGSRQLSFFEADPSLLDFAREATAGIVTDTFRDAVAAGMDSLPRCRNQADAKSRAMSVAKFGHTRLGRPNLGG